MAIEIDYYITMVSKIMSLVNAEKSVSRKVLGAKPKQAGKKERSAMRESQSFFCG